MFERSAARETPSYRTPHSSAAILGVPGMKRKEKEAEQLVDDARTRTLYSGEPRDGGSVLYWMSRDQRVNDNWALLKAYEVAKHRGVPLGVVFCLVPKFTPTATLRAYGFMMRGLSTIPSRLREVFGDRVRFALLKGEPQVVLPDFAGKVGASHVICDFSPLRQARKWKEDVVAKIKERGLCTTVLEVDAHNVVPVWVTSDKQEYAARTIRPKIHKNLKRFLVGYPEVSPLKFGAVKKRKGAPLAADGRSSWVDSFEPVDFAQELKDVRDIVDSTVDEVSWCKPGEAGAMAVLEEFLTTKLGKYASDRNDPNKNVLSNLSPYFHFGQLSPQRAALEAAKYKSKHSEGYSGFIEEMIVRRELSDNFCYYNPKYDSLDGCFDWAKTSLRLHEGDEREYVYTLEQFAHSKTHDDLWNAAQRQLVTTGKMHGYIRMYWAKKILEWTNSPSEALEFALHLNDKYSLDGRDPNGYVGCLWSIGGIHDQGWKEREVFGKIRFMNYNGCKRKFSIPTYVKNNS